MVDILQGSASPIFCEAWGNHIVSLMQDCSSFNALAMEFYFQQNTTMEKYQKGMVNIGKYIKALHSASGHWEVVRLIRLATSQVTLENY